MPLSDTGRPLLPSNRHVATSSSDACRVRGTLNTASLAATTVPNEPRPSTVVRSSATGHARPAATCRDGMRRGDTASLKLKLMIWEQDDEGKQGNSDKWSRTKVDQFKLGKKRRNHMA